MSGFAFGRRINLETQAAIERKQNLAGVPGAPQGTPLHGIARDFFNIRAPWVKLTSGVEIYDDSKQDYFSVGNGSNLALENVLFGLENFGNFALHENANLSLYYGGSWNRQSPELPGTISYEQYGPRPRPGITNVNVTSHGMYGALRTITVSFMCWTPYQLDILDTLYMRPGYTMLLEFGHSHYIAGDHKDPSTYKIKDDIVPIDFFGSDFRYTSQDGTGFSNLTQDIANKKQEYNGAYEGFVGVVKNYNWTFRPDGGYDCSVDLVSKGEIIESLVANTGTYVAGASIESEFTGRLDDLRKYGFEGANEDGWVNIEDINGNLRYMINLDDPNVINTPLNFSQVYRQAFATKDEENPIEIQTFITFQLLNAMMNEFMLHTNDLGESRSPQSAYIKLDTGFEKSRYYTSNIQISADPSVCLLPKTGNVSEIFPGYTYYPRTEEPAENNTIKDILLNISFILKTVKSNTDERGHLRVKDFYSAIFRGIESSTGSINQFELHCDEDNTFYILDRKYLDATGDDPDPIQLYGVNSIVKNLNLVSKLSPKISSLIAISAQDQSSDLGLDATSFRELNAGIYDSIVPRKTSGYENSDLYRISVSGSFSEDDPTSLPENIVIESSQAYLDLVSQIRSIYNQEQIVENAASNLATAYAVFLSKALEVSKTVHASFAIPFELTMTLDGTGGFTVGETFEINGDVLPLSYKKIIERKVEETYGGETYSDVLRSVSTDNKVGFIITGLEQTVNAQGWNTIVKSQIYLKTNPELRQVNYMRDPSFAALPTEWLEFVKAVAWSACFISYCAKQAGLKFPFNAAHVNYAQYWLEELTAASSEGRNPKYERAGFNPAWNFNNDAGRKLRVGDIIIKNRPGKTPGRNTFFQREAWEGNSHGDIVVEVDYDNNTATIIGGNVEDSVTKKTIELDSTYNSLLREQCILDDRSASYFVVITVGDIVKRRSLAKQAVEEWEKVQEFAPLDRKEWSAPMAPLLTEYYKAGRRNPPSYDYN